MCTAFDKVYQNFDEKEKKEKKIHHLTTPDAHSIPFHKLMMISVFLPITLKCQMWPNYDKVNISVFLLSNNILFWKKNTQSAAYEYDLVLYENNSQMDRNDILPTTIERMQFVCSDMFRFKENLIVMNDVHCIQANSLTSLHLFAHPFAIVIMIIERVWHQRDYSWISHHNMTHIFHFSAHTILCV